MTRKKALLGGLAWIAGLGAVYAVLAMFTQGMLGGVSAEEVWWDRVYAWWVDFLAAGFLLLLSVYLWRKSRRLEEPSSAASDRHSALRVVLFPLGHLLLTACCYFADFASYLKDQGEAHQSKQAAAYFLLAAGFIVAAVAAFWSARRLKKSTATQSA